MPPITAIWFAQPWEMFYTSIRKYGQHHIRSMFLSNPIKWFSCSCITQNLTSLFTWINQIQSTKSKALALLDMLKGIPRHIRICIQVSQLSKFLYAAFNAILAIESWATDLRLSNPPELNMSWILRLSLCLPQYRSPFLLLSTRMPLYMLWNFPPWAWISAFPQRCIIWYPW